MQVGGLTGRIVGLIVDESGSVLTNDVVMAAGQLRSAPGRHGGGFGSALPMYSWR